MQRRNFLITPPALALGVATGPVLAAPAVIQAQSRILPRQGKAPRIVICGGGWGGLTAARYLRELVPNADVVVLERNPSFWSGPMSNKWLVDIVGTDFVQHDMLRPANKYGYTLLQTEVTGFERDKKRVRTAHGLIEYDYLPSTSRAMHARQPRRVTPSAGRRSAWNWPGSTSSVGRATPRWKKSTVRWPPSQTSLRPTTCAA